MYVLFIILFMSVNITKQFQLGGSKNILKWFSKNTSKNEQSLPKSGDILPMIMIEIEGQLLPPTHIENAEALKNYESGLLGNTQFAKDNEDDLGRKVFFCPPKDKYHKRIKYLNSIDVHVNEELLFEKTFGGSEKLKCKETANPILLNDENVRCGPNNEGSIYEFFYELCNPMSEKTKKEYKKKSFMNAFGPKKELPCDGFTSFKLYTFCFHLTKKITIFTVHEVISPTLFAYNEIYYDYLKTFTMMTYGYGHFEDEIFEKQRDVYEKRASDTTTKMKQLAQKLVPPEHLFFALWKMPTYHYANVMPQHENLQLLWADITKLILKGSRSMIDHSHLIYTGAFQLPPTKAKTVKFAPQEDIFIPTPDIWICMVIQFPKAKISSTAYKGVAFIMSNHIGEQADRRKTIKEYCGQSSCEDTLRKKFARVGGFIWCCSATEQIQQFFGFYLGALKVLYIHELNFEEELDFNKFDFDASDEEEQSDTSEEEKQFLYGR